MIGIFGASGFIGRHVTQALARNHDVVAVARSFAGDEAVPGGARVVSADLRDVDATREALQGVRTVVQLVSSSSPATGAEGTSEDIRTNVIPHVSFLEECLRGGVTRYIFLSSGGTVYGPTAAGGPIDEGAPTNPISAYGLTKLMVEKLIVMHGHLAGLGYSILRVANPFGPGQVFKNGQGLIPALLTRHEQGLPIKVFGDGSASRDYIYIDDLVSAVEAAVVVPGHQQLTLNIGTGIATSVLEVIRSIEEISGFRFTIEFAAPRRTDVHSIALDVSAAREALGWQPQTTFRDGLVRTLAHYFDTDSIR